MIESLPLAVTRVTTLLGEKFLSNATGFFFERDSKLFVVTNKHVVFDEASDHKPDRIEIQFHVNPENVAETAQYSIPLYRDRKSIWREGLDSAGAIDVVALELDRAAMPETILFHAFTPAHLLDELEQVEMGTRVLIVGFPLGVHDTLHGLPVARQSVIASAFGMRFQGKGYFLTDARLHRGTSGAPVVARKSVTGGGRTDLPWILLGVHASKLDVANRDTSQDEALDLNFAWYADILMTLTQERAATASKPPATAKA